MIGTARPPRSSTRSCAPKGATARRRAGLTLIEVMCALAIAALMMGALFGALSITVRAMQHTRRAMRRTRVIGGIVRVLRRDLEAAFAASEKDRLAFQGRSDVTDGAPCLVFFTTNAFAPAAARSTTGLSRIEYVRKRSSRGPGRYEVARTETAYTFGKPLEKRKAFSETLADGIAAWQLRFYDGAEWKEKWRSRKLPAAVRLDIALEGKEPTPQRTQTYLFTPLASADADPLPREEKPAEE